MNQHSEKREHRGSGGEKKAPGPPHTGQHAKPGERDPQHRAFRPAEADRHRSPDGHTDVDVDDLNDDIENPEE